eukprot:3568762-Rhodomonas_salina.1
MLVPETGGGMNTALLDPDPYILDNLTSSMTPYPFLSWTPNPKPYTLDQNAEQEGNLHEFFDSAGIEESVVGQVDALYGPGLQPHHTRLQERPNAEREHNQCPKTFGSLPLIIARVSEQKQQVWPPTGSKGAPQEAERRSLNSGQSHTTVLQTGSLRIWPPDDEPQHQATQHKHKPRRQCGEAVTSAAVR